MKCCTKCRTDKPITAFYADRQKSDGKTSACKSCINERQAKERKNPRYIYRFNAYQKEWQRHYRKTAKYHEWRKQALVLHSERIKEAKAIIVQRYGGKCACCGIVDICFLTIDHINNDGYKTRQGNKYRSYGLWYYKKIIADNFPTDLQILCFNCNIAKQHNKGICPHKMQQ